MYDNVYIITSQPFTFSIVTICVDDMKPWNRLLVKPLSLGHTELRRRAMGDILDF